MDIIGPSWVPYALSCKLLANHANPICLDLTRFGIDKKFWLKLSPHDSGLSRQLRTYGFREPLNCQYYVRFVEENDTLLDIGANIGFFTIMGSRAKRIICVEPLGPAIALLRENIQLNGITQKCEVVEAAVGPKGKLHIEVNPQMNLSRTVGEQSGNTIDVESIPLDDLVKRYSPNLLRMDVEGYEFEILYDKIPDAIEKISMEFHTSLLLEEKSRKLLAYFKDEGFKVKYFIEDLPLRLYPFLLALKNTDYFKFICYVKSDVGFDEVASRVFVGRGLKYLYLQR